MVKLISNQEIASLLKKVAASYSVLDERKYHFQIVAYENAVDTIENAPSEVSSLWKEGKLGELPGIGTSIKGYLEELFETGTVKHFNELLKQMPEAMFPLMSLSGFGPKKSHKLVKVLKLNDPKTVIKDLKEASLTGKIAKIEGFGEKSQEDILESIKSFEVGQTREKRMNLPQASAIAEDLIVYLSKSSDCQKVDPLGSLRRNVSTIGDIDIAVATKNPEGVINYFLDYPQKQKIIEKGPSGASILLFNGHQVDLRVQEPESYGAMLQYFTGSKNHNVHLREIALKQGLSLSEYGIKKVQTNNIRKYASEEEFYKAIGLDLIPPEIREDTGEIEASLRCAQGQPGGLPKLVELKDIKGDLHIHSDYPIEPSHDLGSNSMKDIINKAQKLNYEYVGFSEHSPSVNKHNSQQIIEILSRRKEKIDQIKLTSKFVRVINLLEIDIQPDGKLSVDSEGLELLDGAIVSIHSSFDQPRGKMTKRILEALSHPKARILGHPTGRLLEKRESIDVDWDSVFDFCQKNNKALEINSWPFRLDLPDVLVRQALKYGIKFVINTDSHSLPEMDLMRYGVSVARRGWAKKNDILNTLSYNSFSEWLSNI